MNSLGYEHIYVISSEIGIRAGDVPSSCVKLYFIDFSASVGLELLQSCTHFYPLFFEGHSALISLHDDPKK